MELRLYCTKPSVSISLSCWLNQCKFIINIIWTPFMITSTKHLPNSKFKWFHYFFFLVVICQIISHPVLGRDELSWTWTSYDSFEWHPLLGRRFRLQWSHMTTMASQITSNSTVFIFRLTTKETSRLHITGPLWGKSTGNYWIPLKGSVIRKLFPCHDVIRRGLICGIRHGEPVHHH